MTAVLYTPHFIQFFDDDGNPLSGGKLYTYEAGTTTPKATYTTEAANVEQSNPVIFDANGRATIFITGSYRFDLFDSNDVLIDSTDNVTSFTTIGDTADAFFQSFSGTGSETSFTLSESLGTDEKLIMVYANFEYTLNGDFETDTDWTKGTGWTIGSGVATATGAISTNLEQDAAKTLVEGALYSVTYTITRDAGSILVQIGGTDGTSRSSAGTYTETIIAGSTQKITFVASGFTGTVDDVTVTKIGEDSIVPISAYTLNGTSLIFNVAPASGTNNIQVWAPARLAGAAATSATAAASSAAAAAASAATAAASEAALEPGTSTTSVLIGSGAKTFTTQEDKGWSAGQFLLVTSDANANNYMLGQVTSYSGTTLEIDVDVTGGSGTFADWTITLSGSPGEQGPAGSLSATSAVVAATTAGASLQSSTNADCITWGSGGTANSTLGGNMSGASTYKLTDMIDPTSAQDYATKNYVDDINGKTSGTVASGDEILFGDIDDSNAVKKTTAQDIANLSSGSFSFVSTTTITGSPSALNFSSVFEADKSYVVEFENVEITDNDNLTLQVQQSGSYTATGYNYVGQRFENGTAAATVDNSTNGATGVRIGTGCGSTQAGESINGTIKFFNPNEGTFFLYGKSDLLYSNASGAPGNLRNTVVAFSQQTVAAVTGFRLTPSSGSFVNGGKVHIYEIVRS